MALCGTAGGGRRLGLRTVSKVDRIMGAEITHYSFPAFLLFSHVDDVNVSFDIARTAGNSELISASLFFSLPPSLLKLRFIEFVCAFDNK